MTVTTLAQKIIVYPPCAHHNYDCKNCPKPLIAQSPKGPLKPCEGTVYFCKFATESSLWKPCERFSLQSFSCTHGGASCRGCVVKGRQWI